MSKIPIGGRNVVGGVHVMPYSTAMRAGDFVFVSGQVPVGPDGRLVDGGIEKQTAQVMENVKRVLAEAGCAMADVVKATVFLADARDFWLFNRAYGEYFPDAPPARSTVRADLMLDAKVEIEVIAYKPPGAARTRGRRR